MNTLVAIVPAFNEELRIVSVLKVLSEHPQIHEIIVIDDCSSDNTSFVSKGFPKTRILKHKTNLGKTHALYTGLTNSLSEFVFLVDADLIGLTQNDISRMIEPVISNYVDMTISLRKNAPAFWKIIGLDYISGERVFRRNILQTQFDKLLTLPKFGFEVFLNTIIISKKLRIGIIPLNSVSSPYKSAKYGIFVGVWGDLKMIIDIIKVISPISIIIQIVKMRKLSKQ